MTRLIPVFAAVGTLLIGFAAVPVSVAAQEAVDLGESIDLGQLKGPTPGPEPSPDPVSKQRNPDVGINPPPAPAPAEGAADKVPQTTPQSTVLTPREQAVASIVDAQRAIDRGEFDRAIEAASRSIALDAENSAAYRKVRAAAYLQQGRYEEALADSKPLEMTVTVARAALKSGPDLVAIVPRGTVLLVDDVNGAWLKVASSREQTFPWAWIKKTAVTHQRPPQPQELTQYPPHIVEPAWEPYYEVRPYHDYGRRYYDYWRHVPPRYWRYLP